ncbi:MAG: ACT domain-containing protein [Candidatus Howiella sp.]|jgi:ACT domain-containing protein
MRAVLTVIGKDTVGILAKVSAVCAEKNVNISEVSQTILQDMFCMIMLCDISSLTTGFAEFADEMAALGRTQNLSIHVMHEDIFNSMHTV